MYDGNEKMIGVLGIGRDITERKQTEELVRNNEEKFRALFEQTGGYCMILDPNTSDGIPIIIDANKAACSEHGYKREEFIGRPVSDIDDEDGKQLVKKRTAEIMTGKPFYVEKEHIRKDGSIFTVAVNAKRIDIGDNPPFILTTEYDITERKKSEKKLKESEASFRGVFNQAAMGVARVAPDGTWLEVNKKLCDIVGYSHKELLSRTFQDITHPDDLQADLIYVNQLLKNEIKTYSMEKRYIKKNGDTIWINLTVSLVRKINNKPDYFISIIEDITDKKNSELQLKKSEVFLKTVIEKSPFPMWISDVQGYLLSINSACRKLLHITEEEVVGKYNILKDSIVIEQGLLSLIESVYQQGNQVNFPMKWEAEKLQGLKFSDSTPVELDVTISPIINDNGKVTNAIIQHLDITKLKRVERELRLSVEQMEKKVAERTHDLSIANEHLKELDQLKSLFIASMSHELRTPLNSIIGFTGMMLMEKMGALNDKQRDYLQRVSGSGKHLLSLITDVIDVSKVEAGKVDVYPERFSFLKLVEEARSNLLKDADMKGLTIRVDIPDINLNTDRKRVLQCLLNYLSNAVKYSDRGEIKIMAVTEGDNIKINVIDQGIGIAQKNIDKLFHQFSRIDSPLSRSTPGTGLGLYLTEKMITQILGGEFGVKSKLGEGSNFWLKIPMEIKK